MVNVLTAEETVHGVARGVDIGGALLVETPQGLRKFVSGEVSVRPDA
jgi:BirA family biotin operon repressor/biotin-[acetyl-CoA-carboxylase] ligase